MSMIFDGFPTRADAEAFASHVKEEFGREATVHDSQEESDEEDEFPFELTPPIVLVDRRYSSKGRLRSNGEGRIERRVEKFNGRFAGT